MNNGVDTIPLTENDVKYIYTCMFKNNTSVDDISLLLPIVNNIKFEYYAKKSNHFQDDLPELFYNKSSNKVSIYLKSDNLHSLNYDRMAIQLLLVIKYIALNILFDFVEFDNENIDINDNDLFSKLSIIILSKLTIGESNKNADNELYSEHEFISMISNLINVQNENIDISNMYNKEQEMRIYKMFKNIYDDILEEKINNSDDKHISINDSLYSINSITNYMDFEKQIISSLTNYYSVNEKDGKNNLNKSIKYSINKLSKLGNNNDPVSEFISNLERNVVKPEKILENIIYSTLDISEEKSWKNINKKYLTSINIPIAGPTKNNSLNNIFIFIDTSASVSNDDLRKYLGIVLDILDNVEIKNSNIIYHSIKVRKIYNIENSSVDIEKLSKVKGRDGTSHLKTIEDIMNNYKEIDLNSSSLLIFISDFESDFENTYNKYLNKIDVPIVCISNGNTFDLNKNVKFIKIK